VTVSSSRTSATCSGIHCSDALATGTSTTAGRSAPIRRTSSKKGRLGSSAKRSYCSGSHMTTSRSPHVEIDMTR
jgi:hypothetical protein